MRPAVMLAVAGAVALAGVPAASAQTEPRTTLDETIVPAAGGGFRQLGAGPGEPHMVRQEGIGTAQPGRQQRRASLLYFAQLTDFQLVDEESPARLEGLDRQGAPLNYAWRPMEALGPQGIDAAIRQVNAFAGRSPVPQGDGFGARMAFALLTGDNIENMQRNETDWIVRLIEGGTVSPNSGLEALPQYTGVADYDDQPVKDTYFYDPDSPEGSWAAWPRYPGLLDRAQFPFAAEGLSVPAYVTFGNHDALLAGNEDGTGSVEAIATGALKVFGDGSVAPVPPDEQRQLVSKKQYKDLFRTARSPEAHGFGMVDPAEEAASRGSAGYYSWKPRPGIRFVALDTVCEGGVVGPSADGNLNDAQFRWLERELRDATEKDELVVLLSHHAIASLTCDIPDEAASACSTNDTHGHDVNPGCDLDPRPSTPLHLGADLTALVQRFPHVIAWVAGHTHNNVIEPFAASGGGFWSVRTASEIDWPPQSRLIELMDNRDGTLSIFGTVIDHGGPLEIPPSGASAAGFTPTQMASISRVFSFNDPQNGAGGGNGPGAPRDHNVELLVRDPRRNPLAPGTRRRCAALKGRIAGTSVGRARLGRRRAAIRRAFPSRTTRRGIDYFCLADGKRIRVGYRKGRAALILTSSRHFALKGVRPGAAARRLRGRARRVLHRRGTRWYTARGRRATLVFRVRGGRVREVGLASRRLTRTRAGTRRLLRRY